ncbi:SPOR domain-containing protein [uncultured Bacteroides sp.]|uniref:HU domain-containing protein n=1 Tax=uncultured Bacteroides sp. TaxID=162156 RepID=UPI002AAC15C0|nr:SPOR domain-containing protein [uncultured Bacteroides sp.]
MIELAQHIEALLLENDCVIVPGFGGFVAHYSPATWVAEECLYLPPTRNIGFNPQIKMNDGLLVQSYMASHDTNFSDASKIIDKTVRNLLSLLHEEGKVELTNIGELHFTIHGTYEFIPYDNKITTPYLYGLDAVSIKPLTNKREHSAIKTSPYITLSKEKKTYNISINRTFLRSTVAVAAVVIMFFMMSTPVENTYVGKENYAQLLPTDLFRTIKKESVATTPVKTAKDNSSKSIRTNKTKAINQTKVKPIIVKEVVVPQKKNSTEILDKLETATKIGKTTHSIELTKETPKNIAAQKKDGSYHIIVASSIGSKDAEKYAQKLRAQGYPEAKVLTGTGIIRVSLMSLSDRSEAGKQLSIVRQKENFKNAWVFTPSK